MQYILSLLARAFAVLLMAFFAYVLCRMRSWDGTEPLYPLIHLLNQNVVFVYLLITGAGWLVISYPFIARPMQYLEALTQAAEALAQAAEALAQAAEALAQAAEALAQAAENPIVLPAALEHVEVQLNLSRERTLRDAMAAKEAEQRKNDLIVYLAHDLKTPLTSIIGYLTLLRDEPDLSPQFRARYTGKKNGKKNTYIFHLPVDGRLQRNNGLKLNRHSLKLPKVRCEENVIWGGGNFRRLTVEGRL